LSQGVLDGVKDALVVRGFGKDLGQHASIGGVEVGDDNTWRDAPGLELEKQEMDGMVVVLRIELKSEDVVGIDIDGEIGIAPDGAGTFAVGPDLRWRANLEPLVVDTDHAAGADDAEIGSQGSRSRAE
jgi:hypothetical protein